MKNVINFSNCIEKKPQGPSLPIISDEPLGGRPSANPNQKPLPRITFDDEDDGDDLFF